MCNPAVAQFGFQAAGQVGNFMSQRAAVRARNREDSKTLEKITLHITTMLFLIMFNGRMIFKILI